VAARDAASSAGLREPVFPRSRSAVNREQIAALIALDALLHIEHALSLAAVGLCDITCGPDPASPGAQQGENYLKPSVTAPSDAPAIRDLARRISGGAPRMCCR